MENLREQYKESVDKRLIMRQRIFFFIIAALIVISMINIFQGKMPLSLALSGFALAIILGIIFSRIFKIAWHPEKKKIVGRLDTLGIILLVLYIGFEIGRKKFFGEWLSGTELNAFALLILTGLFLGRFMGTFIKIRTLLSENENK